MNQLSTILFDLDGTLIDHFQTFYSCYEYLHRSLDINQPPLLDIETMKNQTGGSVPITLKKLLGDNLTPAHISIFEDYYQENLTNGLILLEGVDFILSSLKEKGYQLAVFTNKQEKFAQPICEFLGISDYLTDIIGTTSQSHRKPEPAFTQFALQRLNTQANQTALIGDSPYDLLAASSLNIPAYLLTTGTHSREELENCNPKPHGVFDNMYELGHHIFDLSPVQENV